MNPFENRLPLGWTARPVPNTTEGYVINDDKGIFVFQCRIDGTLNLESQIAYAWYRNGLTWED